LAKLTAI
jgi:hypothetical protein